MGINRESDMAANLQIGPTSLGMVRLYIETEQFELPLDFDPDEAEEIAEELRAAAGRARATRGGGVPDGPTDDTGPAAPSGRGKGRKRR